jgi:hypothetical protein
MNRLSHFFSVVDKGFSNFILQYTFIDLKLIESSANNQSAFSSRAVSKSCSIFAGRVCDAFILVLGYILL